MSTIYKVNKYVRYILADVSIEYMSAIYYNVITRQGKQNKPPGCRGVAFGNRNRQQISRILSDAI